MFLIPYRDETASRYFPFLTVALIAANCYLFFTHYHPDQIAAAANLYGFSPEAMLSHPQVILTSLFLHGSIWHLVGNMWFLWLFGYNLEDRFGRISFFVLYVLSGVIGNLTHTAFSLFSSQTPVIGASGAVAGVMGAYLIRFPWAKLRCVFVIVFYPVFFRLRAFWFIGAWMVGEFVAAYLSPGDYIAHWAHVGGFAFGLVWAYGHRDKYYSAPRSK